MNTKIDNVIQTGPRYAELSSSAKAMVDTLAARYCAGVIEPRDGDVCGVGSENEVLRLHRIMCTDATAEAFEHTGGGVFNTWTLHCDLPSMQTVYVCAFGESATIYALPNVLPEGWDLQTVADFFYELCGEDQQYQIANIYPHECGDNGKVFAAVGKLELAARLLDEESMRIFRTPLEFGQRDALRDGSQSFAMLDDCEARMGFNVAEARALVASAHCLLGECSPDIARTVHELTLCHEYGRTMSAFGFEKFFSADEMMCEVGRESAIAGWCTEFIERWDSEVTGIAAPYASTCMRCSESVARCNENGNCSACESEEAEELRDELAELEEAIETLHASQRDAFARLSGEMSDIRARLRALRMGDEK